MLLFYMIRLVCLFAFMSIELSLVPISIRVRVKLFLVVWLIFIQDLHGFLVPGVLQVFPYILSS